MFLPDLWTADPRLFYASLAFLLLTLFTRFVICLRFVPRLKEGNGAALVWGTLVYMVEPNAGIQHIEPLLNTQTQHKMVDERRELTHEIDRQLARSTLISSIVMILCEDLPELVIEMLYISVVAAKSGTDARFGPVFVISLLTTLIHTLRILYEVRSLLRFLPVNGALDEVSLLSNQSNKSAPKKLDDSRLHAIATEFGGVWSDFNAEYREDLSEDTLVRAACAAGPGLLKLSLFSCTQLTNAGLSRIAGACPRLREVYLPRIPIGDVVVRELVDGCGQTLIKLAIGSCPQLTADCLVAMCGKVPRLEMLAILNNEWVTDDAVVKLLRTTPRLNFLGVLGTAVTDDTMLAVAEACPGMEKLLVQRCPISDAGLLAVAEGCPKLKVVNVTGCEQITEEGKRAANAARPGLFPPDK